ncbi:MAG: hypothetical protein KBT46_05685, partial [Ruminococcus sp.]|nr:hypothetical protein [Candidatus Copronaster equi]
ILSLVLVSGVFTSCGNASTPGKKNEKNFKETPDSIEIIDKDLKSATEDVTAITASTDKNGKVIDNKGIIDKMGHRIYSTGQKDAANRLIYTTGKKDSKGNTLYTANVLDSSGNLIYYAGKLDKNGKIKLIPTNEAPDYSTNEQPKEVKPANVMTTSTTVAYNGPKAEKAITNFEAKYTKFYGGSAMDSFNGVASCNDGGYVVIGQSFSIDGDYKDADKTWKDGHSSIIKYDADGKVIWKYYAGGNNTVEFDDVAVLKDNTIVAVGFTKATNSQAKLNSSIVSGVIYRFKKDGTLMWAYSLPSDKKGSGEYISVVSATPDGGFVVGGKSLSTSGLFTGTSDKGSKAFLFKFDKNCNIKWKKVLSGSMSNLFCGLDVNDDGEIFATCETTSTDGDFSAIQPKCKKGTNTILIKLDKKGNLKWTKYLESTGNSTFDCVCATSDGGCVVGGSYTIGKQAGGIFNQNYGKNDGYVIRYSPNGDVYWAKVLGGKKEDIIKDIIEIDGQFIVVGMTDSSDLDFQGLGAGGKNDGFVFVLNEKGNTSKKMLLSGKQDDAVESVAILDNGDMVVCGWTQSNDKTFKGSGASN